MDSHCRRKYKYLRESIIGSFPVRFANAVLLDVNAGFGVNADFGERVRVRVDVRRLNMVATPLYYVLLHLRAIEGNYYYY